MDAAARFNGQRYGGDWTDRAAFAEAIEEAASSDVGPISRNGRPA